jgi:hypothetical protein
MRPGHSRAIEIAQTCAGVLLVPALWPLSFIGTAIYFPGTIDPLLGGLQNILYLPALIWLLTILFITLAADQNMQTEGDEYPLPAHGHWVRHGGFRRAVRLRCVG